ncbi:MurR/RpiR family transcriptional regulator [Caldifermentibacillus hisashii]|uniref:MurR/RpiR family transcriptional regulator n=1 Tax=Caldifermentibacillus hisashii TaxID=996558 RepID=UPI0031B7B7C6
MLLEKMLRYDDFTPNEEIINEYILKNIDNVIYMTIYELSKKTYTSVSTIVRYCQKLGFEGFKAFKIELTRQLAKNINEEEYISNLTENIRNSSNSFMDLAKFLGDISQKIISKTFMSLSENKIRKIVELMTNAKNIYGIGLSYSYLRLQDFQTKLLRLGINIQIIPLQAEQFYLAYHSTSEDLAILVSYSGNTAEVMNDARILKNNGTPIIAITSNLNSYLAETATVTISVPKFESPSDRYSTFVSQISIEYILNVLYLSLFQRFVGNGKEDKIKSTPISKFETEN